MFLAKDLELNKKVAVKKMSNYSEKEKRMNMSEVYFLSKSQHNNVVVFHKSLSIVNLSEMWVVMEFLEGGTLTDAVRNGYTFTEKQVAYAARELLHAISFLHSQQICHRDIKSSNVKIYFLFLFYLFIYFFSRS